MKKQFKGKQYDYRIIIDIGLYYHFSLSYRDCEKNHAQIQYWSVTYHDLSLE